MIGGIFCIFVSLCSGAIILGARLIHSFTLGGNSELYLYCAAGDGDRGSCIIFSCYVKKRRQDRTREQPDEDEDSDDCIFYTAAGSAPDDGRSLAARGRAAGRRRIGTAASFGRRAVQEPVKAIRHGAPAVRPCIWGEGIVEERLLCGR